MKKIERRGKWIWVWTAAAAAVFLMAGVFWIGFGGLGREPGLDSNGSPAKEFELEPEGSGRIDFSVSGSWIGTEIHSEHGILVNWSQKKVAASKDPDGSTWPASLTKVMTALLAVEHAQEASGAGLDAEVTMTAEDFRGLAERHAAQAGFQIGDQVTVRDLLYGAMMPSGAEAAAALARWTAGSKDAFVEQMNRRAEELGMYSTHFVTVDGLHDPQHVTTVADLARLMEAALKNGEFRTIFTAKQYRSSGTAAHPEGLTFRNGVFYGLPAWDVGTLLGGKSGYTGEAGQCLVSLIQRSNDGEEFFLITTGAYGDRKTQPWKYEDAVWVYQRFAGDV